MNYDGRLLEKLIETVDRVHQEADAKRAADKQFDEALQRHNEDSANACSYTGRFDGE